MGNFRIFAWAGLVESEYQTRSLYGRKMNLIYLYEMPTPDEGASVRIRRRGVLPNSVAAAAGAPPPPAAPTAEMSKYGPMVGPPLPDMTHFPPQRLFNPRPPDYVEIKPPRNNLPASFYGFLHYIPKLRFDQNHDHDSDQPPKTKVQQVIHGVDHHHRPKTGKHKTPVPEKRRIKSAKREPVVYNRTLSDPSCTKTANGSCSTVSKIDNSPLRTVEHTRNDEAVDTLAAADQDEKPVAYLSHAPSLRISSARRSATPTSTGGGQYNDQFSTLDPEHIGIGFSNVCQTYTTVAAARSRVSTPTTDHEGDGESYKTEEEIVGPTHELRRLLIYLYEMPTPDEGASVRIRRRGVLPNSVAAAAGAPPPPAAPTAEMSKYGPMVGPPLPDMTHFPPQRLFNPRPPDYMERKPPRNNLPASFYGFLHYIPKLRFDQNHDHDSDQPPKTKVQQVIHGVDHHRPKTGKHKTSVVSEKRRIKSSKREPLAVYSTRTLSDPSFQKTTIASCSSTAVRTVEHIKNEEVAAAFDTPAAADQDEKPVAYLSHAPSSRISSARRSATPTSTGGGQYNDQFSTLDPEHIGIGFSNVCQTYTTAAAARSCVSTPTTDHEGDGESYKTEEEIMGPTHELRRLWMKTMLAIKMQGGIVQGKLLENEGQHTPKLKLKLKFYVFGHNSAISF
eukprot:sb/3462727/